MTKSRLEAFSDGVLAIIITIMVLELRAPETTDWEHIRHLLPELVSYVLSFAYVAIYWGNHHHLIHTVRKVNAKIIWANAHLLFWLSLVPFVTGWMGKTNFGQVTVAVYGLLMLICGGAYNILNAVIRSGYASETNLSKALGKHRRKGFISLVSYSAAAVLAFVHPYISYGIYLAVAVLWIIPDKDLERAVEEHQAG